MDCAQKELAKALTKNWEIIGELWKLHLPVFLPRPLVFLPSGHPQNGRLTDLRHGHAAHAGHAVHAEHAHHRQIHAHKAHASSSVEALSAGSCDACQKKCSRDTVGLAAFHTVDRGLERVDFTEASDDLG